MKHLAITIVALGLICSSSFAAKITPGNLLVGVDYNSSRARDIFEYTTDGQVVQKFPVEYPGTDSLWFRLLQDIVADDKGNIYIYNGMRYGHMSMFNPETDSWSHMTISLERNLLERKSLECQITRATLETRAGRTKLTD